MYVMKEEKKNQKKSDENTNTQMLKVCFDSKHAHST